MKMKKGDLVLVMIGKDEGKTGVIEKILSRPAYPAGKSKQAVVAGRNVVKKHTKPSVKYPKGGIIDLPQPIDISNIRLICPKCNKITRPKFKIIQDKKTRVCCKCQESF